MKWKERGRGTTEQRYTPVVLAIILVIWKSVGAKKNTMEKKAQLLSINRAEEKDIKYWKSTSAEERLNILQELREQYISLYNKEDEYNEARKRLRRVYQLTKRS